MSFCGRGGDARSHSLLDSHFGVRRFRRLPMRPAQRTAEQTGSRTRTASSITGRTRDTLSAFTRKRPVDDGACRSGPRVIPANLRFVVRGCSKSREDWLSAFRPTGPAIPPTRPSGPGKVPPPRRSSAQRANNPFPQPAGPRFPRSPQPRPIANPHVHAPHPGCRVPVGPGDRRCRFAQPPANFCDPYRGRRSATSSPGTPNDRWVSG